MSGSRYLIRTVIWLTGIAAVCFAAAVLLATAGNDMESPVSAGANSYSRSAIGHRGLVELLGEIGVPVLVSQHDSAGKARRGAALVVAEPMISSASDAPDKALQAMLGKSRAALVVLPKWRGSTSEPNTPWIAEAELRDPGEVERVLRAAGIAGTVVRPSPAPAWQMETNGAMSFTEPTLTMPQLVRAAALAPVFATAQGGVLLGARTYPDGRVLWILSDPDVVANHGLKRGDNAIIAAAVIDAVRAGHTGPVVFDETLHGFLQEPSIWRALLEFPLALATIHALLAAGLLLWAAIGRFGKPAPPAAVIAPGKAFLIANTATLLEFGGYWDHVLERYLRAAIQDVLRALHAPRDMDDETRAMWLTRIARVRGAQDDICAIEREVADIAGSPRGAEERALRAARRICRWRRDIIQSTSAVEKRWD